MDGTAENKFILVAVEHLMSCPIACPTSNATSETIVEFVKKEIILTFKPPRIVFSDNAMRFMSAQLHDFMNQCGENWKTVAEHAVMRNGKVERMVGTIRAATKQCVLQDGKCGTLCLQSVYLATFSAADTEMSLY